MIFNGNQEDIMQLNKIAWNVPNSGHSALSLDHPLLYVLGINLTIMSVPCFASLWWVARLNFLICDHWDFIFRIIYDRPKTNKDQSDIVSDASYGPRPYMCVSKLCWLTTNQRIQLSYSAEMRKVVSAVSTLVLFFCPCCANFWSVYAHRMCIGAYFWLQLC